MLTEAEELQMHQYLNSYEVGSHESVLSAGQVAFEAYDVAPGTNFGLSVNGDLAEVVPVPPEPRAPGNQTARGSKDDVSETSRASNDRSRPFDRQSRLTIESTARMRADGKTVAGIDAAGRGSRTSARPRDCTHLISRYVTWPEGVRIHPCPSHPPSSSAPTS